MSLRTLALGVVVSLFAFAASAQSSVTIDQPPPLTMARVLTFTSVYPPEARQGGRTPQFEFHPRIQVDCYQNGARINTRRSVDPEGAGHRHNPDGTWTGYSDPMYLVFDWDTTQPADCIATLWNPTEKQGVTTYTVYATLAFTIEP